MWRTTGHSDTCAAQKGNISSSPLRRHNRWPTRALAGRNPVYPNLGFFERVWRFTVQAEPLVIDLKDLFQVIFNMRKKEASASQKVGPIPKESRASSNACSGKKMFFLVHPEWQNGLCVLSVTHVLEHSIKMMWKRHALQKGNTC